MFLFIPCLKFLESLIDSGVLTARPVSPVPNNTELSHEEQRTSGEDDPGIDKTLIGGDLSTISERQVIFDATEENETSTGEIAVQDASASETADLIDEGERDLIASVEEPTSQKIIVAPLADMSTSTTNKALLDINHIRQRL